MAEYKVPQDVEAEDRLLGPFTPRQLIYLVVVVLAGAIAWGLSQVFILLAIIPMPIILFFGALALPLRKDQPMETYLAAMLQFYTKPRIRKWDPDGIDSLVEIVAPKVVNEVRVKDISRIEAERRLGYLAQVVDSGGWSIRHGLDVSAPNSAMNSDVYFAAQQAPDVLGGDTSLSRNLESMIEKSAEERRRKVIESLRVPAAPQPTIQTASVMPTGEPQLVYNPFPTDINQAVIQPDDASHQLVEPQPVTSTSDNTPPADIMSLANDVNIETLSKIVNRPEKQSDEVFVSIR